MSEPSPLNPESILGHLPPDYQITSPQEEKGRYHQLLSSEKDVVLRSVDLIGPIVLEEKAKGLSGYAERVCIRLGLEGDLKFSRQKIGQYERIFTTFRLTPPLGLGMSVEALRPYSQRKLRTLGENRGWVLGNVQAALEVLGNAELESEGEVRAAIKAVQAENGELVEEKRGSFENLTLRLPSEEMQVLLALLSAVQVRMSAGDQPMELPEGETLRRGRAALFALAEWGNGETTLLQGGRPVVVFNSLFLPDEEGADEEGAGLEGGEADEQIAAA